MRAILGTFVTLSLLASVASADNVARSDALFAEGKALMATDLHAGCKKLEEAFALNSHAIGVLLNVALCDEKRGKLATAVARFTLARDMAVEQDMQPQLAAASERIAALAPRVPKVTITFAAPAPRASSILIDDKQVVELSSLDDIAVDPGEHKVAVSAPEFLTFTATFSVAEGEKRTVVIAALERAVSTSKTRRNAGIAVASTGAAVAISGLVVGLVARGRYNTAVEGCGDGPCPGDLYSDVNSARSLGNVGTVLGISGLVVGGIGALLFFTAPSARKEVREPGVSVVPSASSDGVGVSAFGRF